MPTKSAKILYNSNNSYCLQNPVLYKRLINLLQVNTGNQYLFILKSIENADLVEWINSNTPQLDGYKLQTKIHWIINDLHDFPICQHCQQHIMKDMSPLKVTPEYCSTFCQRHSKLRVIHAQQTTKNRYGDSHYNNKEKARLTSIIKYGAPNNMQSAKGMAEYKQAMQEKYGVNYSWEIPGVIEKAIETNLHRYGVTVASKLEVVKAKQANTNLEKYQHKCALQNEHVHEKSVATMNKLYNCDHPSQSPELMQKARGKYYYNDIYFDSSPEIAFYIWLVDNNIAFQYKPKDKYLNYTDSLGKEHRYFPDFYLVDTNQLIELKGDNHFQNGKLINITKPELNYIAEAKYQCMIENNVIIYTSKDYKQYVDYVINLYGRNYFKKLKTKAEG